MRPHAERNKTNRHSCSNHQCVSKDHFATEDGNDFVEKSKRRQDENVDLWMSKEPEKMLPKHCRSTILGVKEMSTQIAIQEQHRLRASQNGNRNNHQNSRDQHHPAKQRHSHQSHSWTAHDQDRRDKIDRCGDAPQAADQDSKNPIVGRISRRKSFRSQRRICEPSDIGRC